MKGNQRVGILAIDGGTPVRSTPFPPRRLFTAVEKAAADAVFDESIASGAAIGYGGRHEQAYEQAFAKWLGGGFAKGVNSGTSAVLAALAALKLRRGSEVVCSPITDPGMVMPVVFLGCRPVAADANGFSFNTGPCEIAAALTPRTRAILVAHLMGEPADMPGLMRLARQRRLPVIEDCSQAHGATIRGRLVGTFGDLAVFSTMSGKHHATGAQGGVVFTRREALYWKARRFMDRGKSFGLDLPQQSNVQLGLNLNSNDLAAAIGLVQLRKLPGTVRRRQTLAARVARRIAGLPGVRLGRLLSGTASAYWFLRFTVDAGQLTVDKDRFAAALAKEGIPVWGRYAPPFCSRPWFKGYGPCPALPRAEAALDSDFLVFFHENWTGREVSDLARALAKVAHAYVNV